MSLRDVTVVVRTVGERTETACRQLLAEQVPQQNIVTVSNAPFSATLADSYRIGIERRLPWTFCVDADVLVAPWALDQLYAVATKVSQAVCEIQGLVLDKFFGVRRPAGNHLYRTSLLSKALDLIPTEGQAIRPEYSTLTKMAEQGHPWMETPLVLGLHDFEQYDRDIYRKCFVHARKFDTQMPLLIDYWRRMAHGDRDYHVALAGLAAGITESGDVRVDVRRDNGFNQWIGNKNWIEKLPLPSAQIKPHEIERTLATWASPGDALDNYASYCAREILHGAETVQANASLSWKRTGVLRKFPLAVGRALAKAGRRLERVAG